MMGRSPFKSFYSCQTRMRLKTIMKKQASDLAAEKAQKRAEFLDSIGEGGADSKKRRKR
jgi:hypothetical protein